MNKAEEIYNAQKYTEFDNFIILNYLKNCQKVLDVGCSSGKMGSLIKQRFGSYVCGIDISAKNIEIAKKYLDKAFVVDVEKEFNLDEKEFDVVIFADILEHLYNPLDCIKKFMKYVKPGGYVVLSIPNVANWYVRLKLLLGDFDYESSGILDETHIRFFTFKSIVKMLNNAGLKIEKVNTTYNINIPLFSRSSIFRSFVALITRLNKNLLARQFVVVARRY
ncbi:MAG: class I SAM-dependent methyltransferase [bacterium]|nr:class I SAM-dependent methyltransferase [bacterium]